MKQRPLGNTGLIVSEIGFGAWGIGGRTIGATSYGATDDARSKAALERALERGITFFDTSNVYGDGHSEELLGEVFLRRRALVVIATKAGFDTWDRPPDFSPDHLRRSLEASLRRLRSDYVDLLQLHNPSLDLLRARPETVGLLERLKAEGKIRAFGFSLKSPDQGILAIKEFSVPVVQVNVNLLDVRAQTGGLTEAVERAGAGIIARTPLCFGFLSGKVTTESRFPEGDHRAAWPRAQIARWVDGADLIFRSISSPAGQSRSQMALRYCLGVPGVATVIPGILGPDEVDENAAASTQGPLSPEDMASVLAIHRHNEFFVAESERAAQAWSSQSGTGSPFSLRKTGLKSLL